MQIGLKPDEVLDMSLDVFQACSRGYLDRMFDLQILGVQQGYWAGYYSGNAKRPKSVKSVVDKMINGRNKKSEHAPEVDVESFLKMQEQFQARLNSKVVSTCG